MHGTRAHLEQLKGCISHIHMQGVCDSHICMVDVCVCNYKYYFYHWCLFFLQFLSFCCVCACIHVWVGVYLCMCELCGAYAHVYAGAYIHECVQARGGCQQPVLSFSTYNPETGSLTETRARLKTNTNPPVCDLTTPSSLHGFGSLNSGPQAA